MQKNQGDTRPERRLSFAVLLFTLCGRQVNTRAFFTAAPEPTQQEHQPARENQADNRRDNQEAKMFSTLGMLSASTTDVPVISALVKPIPIIAPISVGAGCRQAEIPGTQVPDDRGQQHREDHGKAMC
jgi:hypothetical protein